jgi:hypothetical protein
MLRGGGGGLPWVLAYAEVVGGAAMLVRRKGKADPRGNASGEGSVGGGEEGETIGKEK